MGFNSTIRQRVGHCEYPGCSYNGPLTKKLCPSHYWSGVKLKSAAKFEERELEQNESLSTVIDDLDTIFSQYIRLRDSDENGYITCYCGAVVYWTEADNSHFVSRAHMNTRFSEENCNSSCRKCNQQLKGNLQVYGAWLEAKRPGSVEALEDQARVQYNYTVSEIKGLISFYSKEVNAMRKKKPLKI